ncbi:MAG: hypothetical protein HY776_00725 [Actinobacteria bacterium]|nr:hypothetical protein [Actinomycetota bacterium]
MKEISEKTGISYHKVCYWMEKHNIPRRSRSVATYTKRNPNGDPFKIKRQLNKKEAELKGFGLGLFWGEGTKSDNRSVRLGNSDPKIIEKFMEFLVIICGVKLEKLRFSLQVFDDIDPREAEKFWAKELGIDRSQFTKTTVTKSRGKGTYKNKIKHGVLTLKYHNSKLRQLLSEMPT